MAAPAPSADMPGETPAAAIAPIPATAAVAGESGPDACYVFKVQGKAWQVVSELRSQLLASGCWVAATRDDQTPHLLLADRGRANFARDLVGRRAPPRPARFAHRLDQLALDARETDLCMVNAYRGCNELTNKSALVRTMRQYAAEHSLSPRDLEYLPLSFVLRPGAAAGSEGDERAEFRQEFLERVSTDQEKNVWIVKANRGAKGDSIFVSDDAEKLIAYVDARAAAPAEASPSAAASVDEGAVAAAAGDLASPAVAVTAASSPPSASASAASATAATTGLMEFPVGNSAGSAFRAPPLRSRSRLTSSSGAVAGRFPPLVSRAAASNSWVVQRYISSPFLLSGRKFDIRSWVLVDHRYRVFLYRGGVCRTSSARYSTADLADRFVHLTNHCIQEGHPDFNAQEEGNEVFFPELQQYLDRLPLGGDAGGDSAALASASSAPSLPPHALCVLCHLLPQIRHVVSECFRSVRARLECAGHYHSWQLFGFDFMLDDAFRLKLLEINATPASAQKLLPTLARHLKQRAIDPLFPGHDNVPAADADGSLDASSHLQPQSTSIPPADAAPFSFADVLNRPCHCASLLRGRSKAEYLAPADPAINLFDLVST